VRSRGGSTRPSCGAGIRTAVRRTDRRFLQDVGRNPAAWTANGTFPEALAFVTGYDAARAGSYLPAFQRWLARRVGRADGSLAELVLASASLADGLPLEAADDARATAALFALMDDWLAATEGSAPP
jgi:hypothetical protein